MNVEYRVLGPLEVLRDGVRVPVPAGRGRVLLATLLLRPNRFVSVDELVERLWDGEPPTLDRAHKTLQMVVRRLRMALGDANCVRTATGGYLAEVDQERLDLTRFRQLAAEGEFGAALAHWRGEVASNVASRHLHREDVPPLVEERLVVHGRRIEADLAHGRGRRAGGRAAGADRRAPAARGVLGAAGAGVAPGGTAGGRARRVRADPRPPRRRTGCRARSAVARPARPAARPGRAGRVPRQLPVGAVHFAGRDDELARLTEVTRSGGGGDRRDRRHRGASARPRSPCGGRTRSRTASRTGSCTSICAASSRRPIPPTRPRCWSAFLGAFGVSGGRVPVDLPERAALYRSVVADRRVLVLLDNARDVEQVRPLLPAGRGCLVVITSRNRFTGLVVREGAVPVTLDLLSDDDAVALLTARLGAGRGAAEPDASPTWSRSAAACRSPSPSPPPGWRRPGLTLRELVDELTAADGLMTHVDAVFATSYRQLDDHTARLFRLHRPRHGPDISLDAATALDGRRRAEVRKSLHALTRMHLPPNAHRAGTRATTCCGRTRGRSAGDGPDHRTARGRATAARLLPAHGGRRGPAAAPQPGRA